jgi:colicin import membrane protein
LEQHNLELKVWKDLAVSNQILMRAASNALGLSPDCTSSQLEIALHAAIKRGAEADASISKSQTKFKTAISAIEIELGDTKRALTTAEEKIVVEETGRLEAEHRVTAARDANTKELKKATQELAKSQKTIKAINTSLADTPENVVKKLKKLKKEKFDEATSRKRAEDETRALKKTKKKLEKTIEEHKSSIENSTKLAEKYRQLYEVCKSQREQLESLVEDKDGLVELPKLDEHLLEIVEKAA